MFSVSLEENYITALDLSLEEQCEFQGFSTAAPPLSEPPLNTEFLLWKSNGAKPFVQMIHPEPHSLPEESGRCEPHLSASGQVLCYHPIMSVSTKYM